MSCGVGYGCGLEPILLWLWCGPAAVALIISLVWDFHTPQVQPQKKKRKKKKKNSVGVPAIAQWVKNLTAAAQVAVELGVQSPPGTVG